MASQEPTLSGRRQSALPPKTREGPAPSPLRPQRSLRVPLAPLEKLVPEREAPPSPSHHPPERQGVVLEEAPLVDRVPAHAQEYRYLRHRVGVLDRHGDLDAWVSRLDGDRIHIHEGRSFSSSLPSTQGMAGAPPIREENAQERRLLKQYFRNGTSSNLPSEAVAWSTPIRRQGNPRLFTVDAIIYVPEQKGKCLTSSAFQKRYLIQIAG